MEECVSEAETSMLSKYNKNYFFKIHLHTEHEITISTKSVRECITAVNTGIREVF